MSLVFRYAYWPLQALDVLNPLFLHVQAHVRPRNTAEVGR